MTGLLHIPECCQSGINSVLCYLFGLKLCKCHLQTITRVYLQAKDIKRTNGDMQSELYANHLLMEIWPSVSKWLCDRSRLLIPWIDRSLPNGYQTKDIRFYPGKGSPQICSLSMRENIETGYAERMETTVDMEVWYGAGMEAEVLLVDSKQRIVAFTLKNIQMSTQMRAVLKSPIYMLPCLSSVLLTLTGIPMTHFDVEMSNESEAFSAKSLKKIMENALWAYLADNVIFPQRRFFAYNNFLEIQSPDSILRPPDGIIRVHLKAVKYIDSAVPPIKKEYEDVAEGEEICQEINPFVRVQCGKSLYITLGGVKNHVDGSYTWNEAFDVEVYNSSDQYLSIKIFYEPCTIRRNSKYKLGPPVQLGHFRLRTSQIGIAEQQEQWYLLKRDERAKMCVSTDWLVPSRDVKHFETQANIVRKIVHKGTTPLATGILLIYADRVKNLPSGRDGRSVWNKKKAHLVLVIVNSDGKEVNGCQSASVSGNDEPVFRFNTSLLIQNPKKQKLKVTIMDTDSNAAIVSTTINISSVFHTSNMQSAGWRSLSLAGTNETESEIMLYLRLRSFRSGNFMHLDAHDAFGEGLFGYSGEETSDTRDYSGTLRDNMKPLRVEKKAKHEATYHNTFETSMEFLKDPFMQETGEGKDIARNSNNRDSSKRIQAYRRKE